MKAEFPLLGELCLKASPCFIAFVRDWWDCNVWNIMAVIEIEHTHTNSLEMCLSVWNHLALHTRLSNVPELRRSAVLLQRHVVFAGRDDATRSAQPISAVCVRGHVRTRALEPRAHVCYCEQRPLKIFSRFSRRHKMKKEPELPSPRLFSV